MKHRRKHLKTGSTRGLWPQRIAACGGLVLVVLAALVALVVPNAARAYEVEREIVRATLSEDLRSIEADVEIRLRDVRSDEELALWLWGARIEHDPPGIDEMHWRWVFPGNESFGEYTLDAVTLDGTEARVRVVSSAPDEGGHGRDVRIALGAARSVAVVRARVVIALPQRFGRLGRAHDVSLFAGPWYPVVVGDAGPVTTTHEVTVEAGESDVRLACGREARTCEHQGHYVPIIASETLYSTPIGSTRTARARLVTSDRLPTLPSSRAPSEEGLLDLAYVPRRERLSVLIDRALATCATFPRVCAPRPLDVWLAPLRLELAAESEGVVLVSDRAYEVSPLEAIVSFHDRAVLRVMFRALLRPFVERTEHTNVEVILDALALVFVELDLRRRAGEATSAEDLLSFASFHPAVDQLLYAPQLAFADVYFAGAEDRSPFREDPMQAFARTLGGRRWLSSVRVILAEDADPVLRRWVEEGTPIGRSLESLVPDALASLRARTARGDAEVNYRIADVESREENGQWVHRIRVGRDGDDVVEPVVVRVVDRAGGHHDAVWNGAGAEGVVEVTTDEPLDDVALDPRNELLESARVSPEHPRADDRLRLPWRPPVLQAFNVAASTSESRVDGVLDFVMRKRFALDDSLGFRVESDATGWGASARYTRFVGPKRDTNNRIGTLTVGLSGMRLRPGFADANVEGWAGALTLSGGVDTRYFRLDPREGFSLVGSARFSGVARDDHGLQGSIALSTRGTYTTSLGWRNTFAFIGGAGVTIGSPVPSDLQNLGGATILRGYEAGELVGRAKVYGIAEYRFTALTDLHVNVLQLLWLRELQLVAFAGGGALFADFKSDTTTAAFSAGGGIRLHFDYGGVQPGLLAFDFAVPVLRENAAVIRDGVVVRERVPYAFYISFEQFY